MVKYCEVCGNEIPRGKMSYNNKKYQTKKYCSAKCHHESMKKEFRYNCAECGEVVIRTKENIKRNVFCNDVCKGKYNGKNGRKGKHKNQNRINKTCSNCSIPYSVNASRKNSKFCSSNCRAEYNAKVNVVKQQNRISVECDNCNEIFEKVPSDIREHNFCCNECMYGFYSEQQMFAGENSGTWNGGKKEYKGDNWQKQRRKARKRDKYTCQDCGITEEEYGQQLSVHHIIPFILFNDNYEKANCLSNLICVCEPCHRIRHTGENHPSKFNETYKNLVDDIV